MWSMHLCVLVVCLIVYVCACGHKTNLSWPTFLTIIKTMTSLDECAFSLNSSAPSSIIIILERCYLALSQPCTLIQLKKP